MTPGARLAAAIDLLTEMEEDDRPADAVAGSYLRSRRYIGAKDRRAISERVWGCLRRRARLGWWLALQQQVPTARGRMLAELVLTDHLSPDQIAELFAGDAHGPGALSSRDRALIQALRGRDLFHHDMPAWVRGEYPDWLEPRLALALGESFATEMAVMRDEATVDLRVNTLKGNRATAQAALAQEGIEATPTALSPIGLRLSSRLALTAQVAFRAGLVEVQDEGSQLVGLLTGARPGQSVVDFCAGAGGKTLVLAATMENKGRLVACDTHAARADRAVLRLRRAGVHNVERRLLEPVGDKWIKRRAGSFDRVLVDSPCSGTGTWRRNPDAKWRLSPAGLDQLLVLQGTILASAARLVRPGGRLVYATCSVLTEENEAQAEAFLASHPDFRLIPLAEQWAETIGGVCPIAGPYLRLSPAKHGTDGFFAAILERHAAPTA